MEIPQSQTECSLYNWISGATDYCTAGVSRLFCPKNQIIRELKIAQYKMYTKFLAQGTKFGSGTTGLDNPAVQCTVYILVYSYTILVCYIEH